MKSPVVERRLVGVALWRRLDEPAFEHCRLWEAPETHDLEGCVLTTVDGRPAEVRYAVECGLEWETRTVRVTLTRGESTREMELRRDARGVWWRNGQRLAELDGLPDVDLGFTPSTNTPSIRRLALAVGDSAEVEAVWVRFPDLAWERLPQRYTRLEERRFRYESAGGAFVAELETDANGLVMRYDDLWERVGAQ